MDMDGSEEGEQCQVSKQECSKATEKRVGWSASVTLVYTDTQRIK